MTLTTDGMSGSETGTDNPLVMSFMTDTGEDNVSPDNRFGEKSNTNGKVSVVAIVNDAGLTSIGLLILVAP
jgi:hypothetical protein